VGGVGIGLLLITMLMVVPGELGRIPFDAPEAETELAGGLLVEYSGRNLALFYLSLAVKTIVVGALIVALFFPYNLSGMLSIGSGLPALLADILFFGSPSPASASTRLSMSTGRSWALSPLPA